MAGRPAQDAILNQILQEFKEMNSGSDVLYGEIKALKETLDPIVKMIRGDGINPSIPTKIALLEQLMVSLNTIMMENKNTTKELRQDIDDLKRIQSSTKHQKSRTTLIIVAIISGASAIAGALIAALVKNH